MKDDLSELERKGSQKWVLLMGLSMLVEGTEMSWREILETGQVEWKGRIKGKMVGMEMERSNMLEETGNYDKRLWNEEIEIC